jgi:hypothetical protein
MGTVDLSEAGGAPAGFERKIGQRTNVSLGARRHVRSRPGEAKSLLA